MSRSAKLIAAALICATAPAYAQDSGIEPLTAAAEEAQRQLRQTFTNLTFEDFGPAPVRGRIYQAIAGGRVIYFAPESQHLLFAAIYDKNGVNLTRSEEQTSELQSLMRISYAVFCLKNKKTKN